jgi:hypothetical protein
MGPTLPIRPDGVLFGERRGAGAVRCVVARRAGWLCRRRDSIAVAPIKAASSASSVKREVGWFEEAVWRVFMMGFRGFQRPGCCPWMPLSRSPLRTGSNSLHGLGKLLPGR